MSYDCLDDDPSDFDTIGEAFAATGLERPGPVGAGRGRMMRSRDLVDFATDWMHRHRTWATVGDATSDQSAGDQVARSRAVR
jgi:aminoglycoside N3'-acetyltransferase